MKNKEFKYLVLNVESDEELEMTIECAKVIKVRLLYQVGRGNSKYKSAVDVVDNLIFECRTKLEDESIAA